MSRSIFSFFKPKSQAPLQFTTPVHFAHGNFGEIFKTFDVKKKCEVAMKVERNSKVSVLTLKNEAEIMTCLKDIPGVSNLIYFLEEKTYSILFMPLYGKNMKEIFNDSVKYFSAQTFAMGAQIIEVLEKVHAKNIVHRDLKPANIVLSADGSKYILIDFGLATYYRSESGKHVEDRSTNQYIGNLRFGSINSHFFREMSRKDDLESLGYVLWYLFKGELPWDKIDIKDQKTKIIEMGKIKAALDLEKECFGLPEELCKFLKYVKNLKFDEDPNYTYLKELLLNIERKQKIFYENEMSLPLNSVKIKKKDMKSLEKFSSGKNSNQEEVRTEKMDEDSSFLCLCENYQQTKNQILGFQNPFTKFQSSFFYYK